MDFHATSRLEPSFRLNKDIKKFILLILDFQTVPRLGVGFPFSIYSNNSVFINIHQFMINAHSLHLFPIIEHKLPKFS